MQYQHNGQFSIAKDFFFCSNILIIKLMPGEVPISLWTAFNYFNAIGNFISDYHWLIIFLCSIYPKIHDTSNYVLYIIYSLRGCNYSIFNCLSDAVSLYIISLYTFFFHENLFITLLKLYFAYNPDYIRF